MRVAFLTKDLALSGGVGVVIEHARRLSRDHGFTVTLVHTGDLAGPRWSFAGLDELDVTPLDAARGTRFDVAVSTWWETATSLFELDARRYASFVQSLEDRFYPSWAPERIAAGLATAMPVRHITEARWIAEALDDLQPGTRTLLVRNSVAKDVFTAPDPLEPARSGPLRIVVEGSRAFPLKGVDEALRATARMREDRHVTLVTPDDSGAGADADVVRTSLPPTEMAAVLRDAHVVLKLSRVEGMAGPPLEGFHCGTTCVTTPVTGHEEYVRHRHNALVVDFDDPAGTVRALDLLARDRALLHVLRTNALATATGWPTWSQQSAVMAAVLRTILRDPPPDPRRAALRLGHDAGAMLGHAQRQLLAYNEALAAAESAQRQLAEVRNERLYRWGVRARRVVRPNRRT